MYTKVRWQKFGYSLSMEFKEKLFFFVKFSFIIQPSCHRVRENDCSDFPTCQDHFCSTIGVFLKIGLSLGDDFYVVVKFSASTIVKGLRTGQIRESGEIRLQIRRIRCAECESTSKPCLLTLTIIWSMIFFNIFAVNYNRISICHKSDCLNDLSWQFFALYFVALWFMG